MQTTLRRLSSTMSSRPQYIYKIIPHSSVDTRYVDSPRQTHFRPFSLPLQRYSTYTHSIPGRYAFPIPIPASHTFFLSKLDYEDGFIHLSTARQVLPTLNRYFSEVPQVVILRLETERVGAWKRVTWDRNEQGQGLCAVVVSI